MLLPLTAWWLLSLVVPILATGRFLCRRVPWFARFNLPVPVVGGFAFALLVWALGVAGVAEVSTDPSVRAPFWTWLTTAGPEWQHRPAQNVNLPFLVGFFTCVGLNATWSVLRRGSWQLLLFWVLASALAVVQNGVGVTLAPLLGESPVLGLACGSVTMTGGHGTALGFAGELEKAGLAGASLIGAAGATFGLVAGGLLGGPLATALIRRGRLATPGVAPAGERGAAAGDGGGFLGALRRLAARPVRTLVHLLLLGAAVKAGAWVSLGLRSFDLVFPVYMGAMVFGAALRNLLDAAGRSWLDSAVIDDFGLLLLGVFLAIAMATLNLGQLAGAAGPMLVILAVQVVVTALFAWWITFRLMGRDYEAAVIAGGHCGFALGATPTAVANMEALVERFGPAHRAFLVVPPVGAALIDVTNGLAITTFLNVLR